MGCPWRSAVWSAAGGWWPEAGSCPVLVVLGVAAHRKPARGPPSRPHELWVQLADEAKEPLDCYQEAVTVSRVSDECPGKPGLSRADLERTFM